MPLTLSKVVGKFLKYGQIMCVYPGAFQENKGFDYSFLAPDDTQQVELITSDGVQLRCLYLPARRRSSARTTAIIFHGNGCHVWHHVPCGVAFTKMGCNALMVSYRGYGQSQGKPSEKGLRKDAQAALDYILSHPRLSRTRIVLHGHSLGGAVAIDLASRNPTKISALIVENTFTSIPEVARDIPFIHHFTWFIHQKWNSAAKISLIPRSVPILMISGALDEVVPPKHMSRLWRIARERGKDGPIQSANARSSGGEEADVLVVDEEYDDDRFTVFPYGSHADTWAQDGYWRNVKAFLSNLQLLSLPVER